MNDQDNNADKELNDFLNGESEINKVYAERESLTAPAHLELRVKQMAKDDITREDILNDDISSEDRSGEVNTKSDKSGAGTTLPSATKSRKYFMPVTLAASFVVALTITVVLFQDQSAQIQVAQNPIDDSKNATNQQRQTVPAEQGSEPQTPLVSEPVIDIAQQQEALSSTPPLAQQRVAPTAKVNVANDVKKTKIEKREQLATKTGIPKNETTEAKLDSPQIAQQSLSEIPPHISELLQNTNASDQKLDAMPPQEVLKGWQKTQWVEQVKLLTKQGKHKLAERYAEAYPDYFPNDSIQYLLKP